jgi:hypothetical protein
MTPAHRVCAATTLRGGVLFQVLLLSCLGCATQTSTAKPTPAMAGDADHAREQVPDCKPLRRAHRIWVGFSDRRFDLADFERAAMRSELVVELVCETACELGTEVDAGGALRQALTEAELELHSVTFTRADLERVQARLRPVDELHSDAPRPAAGLPAPALRFRVELEQIHDAERPRFRIVRAVRER